MGTRIFRIIRAWWHSCRGQIQAKVAVTDLQYQQQQQQKQATLAQAAAQQQLGLLEAEKRRCQQQLQQLAAALQANETAALQALQQQNEPLAMQHLLQLAVIEQQQLSMERQMAQLLQQLSDQTPVVAATMPAPPQPLDELQQLALQARAEQHLQRLKAPGDCL